MITVISPAKSLNYDDKSAIAYSSEARMLDESEKLMKVLKKKSPKKLMDLQGISENLGQLNFERNQVWQTPLIAEQSKQALFAFTGDVYVGFNAETLNENQVDHTQSHLRILSGLYGVLRPFDMMMPYRLEMGTSLKTTRGKNLYEFWKDRITDLINEDLKEANTNLLLNLASNEYFKSINTKKLNAEVISPSFLDWSNGKYKVLSFFAKKARGMMARFVIDHQISKPDDLRGFDVEGYLFDEELSKENKPVFTRKQL